ncbi:MAG: tetratricopeptide repeat protein [Polyangiales bacterium]
MADIQSDKAHVPAHETAGSRLAAKRAAKAAQKAASRGTSSPVEDVAKSVLDVSAWVDVHGRKLALGAGALVALVVAAILVSSWRSKSGREAGALLQSAVATSHGLIIAPEDTPPEDAIVPVFTSAKERDEKALKQFREVVKQYAGSAAAPYAALGEANALLELGKPDEASAAFEKLRSSTDESDAFLRFRVLEGAGYALEAQKKPAEARERFEALSKLNNGAYRVVGDYHRARMLVAEGKRDEAKKLLEELNKSLADKPAEATGPTDRFDATATAAQTLLSELGGQPVERATGGSSGISQQVLDSLRKQLGSQKK